jgi:hypothetical protein
MKKTVHQRAEELGTTRDALNKIRSKGVNIWNDEEVKKHRDGQQLRIQFNRKKPNAESFSATEPLTIADLEKIIVNPASDYTEIKTAKERLICLTASQKLRRELAESFSADEVRVRDQKIATAVQRAMAHLEADLPSRCEGLSASKMKVVMRAFVTQLLTDLSDSQSPFWAEAE